MSDDMNKLFATIICLLLVLTAFFDLIGKKDGADRDARNWMIAVLANLAAGVVLLLIEKLIGQ